MYKYNLLYSSVIHLIYLLLLFFLPRKLFRLKEDPETKAWDHEVMNMCDIDRCTPPLSKLYSPRIISFGEDEAGQWGVRVWSFVDY